MFFRSAHHYKRSSAYNTILKATFVAGTLDILIALVQFYLQSKRNPVVVLNYIASAVFSRAAFTGGTLMALWGLFFHYVVTLFWAILFFMIYRKVNGVTGSNIITGIVYALVIWLGMNLVVLPLSAIPSMPFNIRSALTGAAILVIAVGLPFSFIMKKHFATEA